MNFWTKRSTKLAYELGYLDRLLEIYPIKSNPRRLMPQHLWNNIKKAYNEKNSKELIRLLNKGVKSYKMKFPVECYYTSSLRNETRWIDLNPKTVKKLSKLVLDQDIDVIFDKCTAPKKVSRQAGPMFDNWFQTKFRNDREIKILGTNDNERKKNAKKYINYNSNKGLDVFININEIYILGEAKFITDSGGTQTNQFKSALNIINTFDRNDNVIPIAIIDGHCWRKSEDFFYKAILNSEQNQIIISALLLEDFFNKVKEIDTAGQKIKNSEIINYLNSQD
ncbi:MAG: hypothetical protein CEE42_16380 [Promethearchaeota archaeon Loki_b31]|nr:MAG: hypothetical protein CEE42_16380 [Candidatus Lokiarchaeota archaeon Loki_b31]